MLLVVECLSLDYTPTQEMVVSEFVYLFRHKISKGIHILLSHVIN